ncbi:hypothetical protein [Listeria booriae]|uniref:hypothetical protein n=1 Tax=Listeria booriae TaxID=1552123 RepID=UPI001626E1FB|nr:hypothetical protein [Listeria booriae]MBC2188669.1 hypothetical protein [Listeria booriae]
MNLQFSAETIESIIDIAKIKRDDSTINTIIETHEVSSEDAPYVVAFLAGYCAALHGAN